MAKGLTSLFSFLKPTVLSAPQHVVGIDFGSSSVKVVEIMRDEGVLTLKTYGELQLGPYGQKELGSVTQLDAIKKTEALVDVLRESKVTAHTGVMTLQLSSSFVTVFSLNAKAGEDLGPRVRVEARKYIPIPMSDVSLDWSELPPAQKTPEGVREVLIAAVQKEASKISEGLLQKVKLGTQMPEIEIFSTLRAVSKKDDTSVAIIDLGAQTSKLYIANEGTIRKVHRVFAGGAQATQRISDVLHLSFEDAENEKRNYNVEDPSAKEIKKAVVATFERSLQEFKRVLTQYELRMGQPIQRVIITGGSSAFAEMQTYVSFMLDRKVERVNVFSKVAYPAFMEDVLTDIAPLFTAALGAALRPFEMVE